MHFLYKLDEDDEVGEHGAEYLHTPDLIKLDEDEEVGEHGAEYPHSPDQIGSG
jgi:hypothetical protein